MVAINNDNTIVSSIMNDSEYVTEWLLSMEEKGYAVLRDQPDELKTGDNIKID